MEQNNTTASRQDNNFIRTLVRGIYDLQGMRIQMGNRITVNFKAKLGLTQDGMSERELGDQEKRLLTSLRDSYNRITDGIVAEGQENTDGKLPTLKKFKGDEVISTYAELVLVDQYMKLLSDEEKNFRRLGNVLEGIPIYDQFLIKVKGIGPAMAGVLISEIDIYKAEYPSSLWAYAGLDAVTVGVYKKDDKEVIISMAEIDQYYETHDRDETMMVDGKYEVSLKQVGRSLKSYCLVDREYTNKEGKQATKKSITYNPFLKTKLIGVLGSSFLKTGNTCFIDGVETSSAARMKLAKDNGFVMDLKSKESSSAQVITFLRAKDYEVKLVQGEYSARYYEYKARLDNHPNHKDKTPAHKHNMAVRFMVKRFLVNLYTEWKRVEGLPVAAEYSEAKLGIVHKKAA